MKKKNVIEVYCINCGNKFFKFNNKAKTNSKRSTFKIQNRKAVTCKTKCSSEYTKKMTRVC